MTEPLLGFEIDITMFSNKVGCHFTLLQCSKNPIGLDGPINSSVNWHRFEFESILKTVQTIITAENFKTNSEFFYFLFLGLRSLDQYKIKSLFFN